MLISVETRLPLQKLLLLWEGRLSNARLRALFNISQVRASEWIREFRESHPQWVQWDSRARCHLALPAFYKAARAPDFAPPDSLGQYLMLTGVSPGVAESVHQPLAWAAYPALTEPNPQLFATVHAASLEQQVLRLHYRSMREPAAHIRTVRAHTVVRAGRRWHLRAFCAESNGFRDYTLGRIVRAERVRDAPLMPGRDDDALWNQMISVDLCPHPELSAEQRDLVAFESFGGAPTRIQTCRAALLSYFLQDMQVAVDVTRQRPPAFQMAVANIDEVRPWLFTV